MPDSALFDGISDLGIADLDSIDAVDLLARPYVAPAFFAQHIIPKKALVLFSGDSGAAKTALLMHASVCMAAGIPVAGRFDVEPGVRVLYVNGEMSDDTLTRYLQEAAAGIGAAVPRDRLFFEGADGVATWRFGENPSALAALVAIMRPDVVIIDTQRALLVEDENDAAEVRRVFGWIRTHIINAHGASVVIAHHLRKIGAISNSARQRVAGTTDIIAGPDVHLAAKARDGAPLHALYVDKTRFACDGVAKGTEWPVDARLEPGAPNRSIFVARAPESPEKAAAASATAEDAAVDELRARLETEGELTIDELDVNGGARKRAWERLRKNEVVPAGKRGRKTVYALRESLPDQEELL